MSLKRFVFIASFVLTQQAYAQSWVSLGLDTLQIGYSYNANYAGDLIYTDGQLLYVGTNKGLFHSKNGGLAWQKIRVADNLPDSVVNAIGSTKNQTLYVAMGRSAILRDNPQSFLYKTTDGGLTWKCVFDNTVIAGTNIAEVKISPLDPNLVIALHRSLGPGAGNLDKIFRSTDGGTSWKDVSSASFNQSDHGVRIQIGYDPRDSTRWYATGDTQFDLTFYVSTDAGASWTPKSAIPDGINQKILVDARDHERIYLIGGLTGVLVSTNGGGSWTVVNELANQSVLKLTQHQKKANILLASTAQGVVVKMNDSSPWVGLGNGLPWGKYYDVFVDTMTNVVYAGGDRGLFRNDAITSISEKMPVVPSEFQLSQNFPNPFNPTTRIEYTVPKRTFVKVAIYDVLGKEIKTLEEGVKEAGRYSTIFNATGLQSGVYFYRLISNDYIGSKKMILLK